MVRITPLLGCVAVLSAAVATATPVARSVGMEEAVEWAVARNLGVALAAEALPIATGSEVEAAADFDTTVTAGVDFDHTETPTASDLFGTTRESVAVSLGLTRRFALGTEASLKFTGDRQRDNFPFSTLNPRFDAALDLAITQPLLRGGGTAVNLAPVRLARVATEVEAVRLRAAMEEVVLATEEGYWHLVEAGERLKVARASRELARSLAENVGERVRVGGLPPYERLGAEAEVALREEGVAVAEQALADAQDRLLEVTGVGTEEDESWELRPVPAPLPPIEAQDPDLDVALARAREHRTDLALARLARERRGLEAARADNLRLPDLALTGRVGAGGLTGDQRVQELADQLGRRDFFSYGVGLALTYPLGNRAGRAAAEQAHHRHRQADLALRDAAASVVAAVRAAVREVATSRRRIAATAKAVASWAARLDAEEEKFRVGVATPHDVLEAQRDLTEARERNVASRTAYLLAVARLWDAEGMLLERHHLRVEAADAPGGDPGGG